MTYVHTSRHGKGTPRSPAHPLFSQSIELKAAIKRKMTNKTMVTLLGRLEINGEPVWGLSAKERELVYLAREKFNAC